jgi:hypothetical protein
MKLSQIQTRIEKNWPWGANGNVITVGHSTVTAIELSGPNCIVSATDRYGRDCTNKPAKWVINDVTWGKVAEETGIRCEHCGVELSTEQAMANHRRSCGPKPVEVPPLPEAAQARMRR